MGDDTEHNLFIYHEGQFRVRSFDHPVSYRTSNILSTLLSRIEQSGDFQLKHQHIKYTVSTTEYHSQCSTHIMSCTGKKILLLVLTKSWSLHRRVCQHHTRMKKYRELCRGVSIV